MEKNSPQPERTVDAIVVSSLMTPDEARQCIEEIKGHLNSVRKLLLELEERRGWEVLGYKSMRQCMLNEFTHSKAHLYRELKAGKVEKKVSPMGDIGIIPERQLREIGKLPEQQWSSAWEQIVETAPPKGVTTSHVAKTVAQIKSLGTAEIDREFVLGEWVRVKTRRRSSNWDGMRGVVTKVEEYEITVQLDDDSKQLLRFYRDELVKIDAPNRELNQLIEQVDRIGDLVTIDCPGEAEFSQRLYNGYWGQVISMGDGVVEVVVKGKPVKFMKSDVKPVDNPTPVLREIVEKVNQLLSREDLDELDKQILEFYVGRFSFTDNQLKRLEQVWDTYKK
ncbi:MAG: hypothetical protein QNJ54_35775 [Prochloraceae cyanobacterium]|nr:hypothetical protein [Prochloraceae cyanobacterium]